MSEPEYVNYGNELYLRRPPDVLIQPSCTVPLSKGRGVGVFSRITLVVMTYYMLTLLSNTFAPISSMFVYCSFTYILWNSYALLVQCAKRASSRAIKAINS